MKTSWLRLQITSQRGFTLIELMITVLLSSIIFAAGYQMFAGQRRSYSLQNDLAEMQQQVRGCEQMMTREIRMAGYNVEMLNITSDVPGTSFSDGVMDAFEEATMQSIAFTTDVEGDGTVETIRYSLRGSSLVREMWRWDTSLGGWRTSGGARSLSEHIEQMHLGYWLLADSSGLNNGQDDDGDFLVDEEGELSVQNEPDRQARKHIRMIRLTLTAKTSRPDHRYKHPLYGDHYRRMTITSTIQPRNVGL